MTGDRRSQQYRCGAQEPGGRTGSCCVILIRNESGKAHQHRALNGARWTDADYLKEK